MEIAPKSIPTQIATAPSVATDAEAILQALKPFLPRLRRVGHEAGSLSPWLHPELKALGIPAVCLETHHVRAAMSAQRNKTDAADALGLAHIVRTGWFKAAFIKSEPCYRMRLLLSQRRNLDSPPHAVRHRLAMHKGKDPSQSERVIAPKMGT